MKKAVKHKKDREPYTLLDQDHNCKFQQSNRENCEKYQSPVSKEKKI